MYRLFGLKKEEFEGISLMLGAIVGAGILGIPFVIAKSGLLNGLILIVVVGLAIMLINLYVGEISLRTKGCHEIPKYAEIYIGKWAKHLMAISLFVGSVGALIAYIIGEGQSLSAIFGGNALTFSLAFFVIVAFIMFGDLKYIAGSELFINIVAFIAASLIIIFSVPFAKFATVSIFNSNFMGWFFPYGIILFAFAGMSAIPEVREELRNKKSLKKCILIGSLIPLVLYFIFALVVVGVTGTGTTEISTIGLGKFIGQHMILFGNLFAIFAMSTSFLVIGLAMKWMFQYDYGINRTLSWFLTCFIPLGIVLLGWTSFAQSMGIAGAVAGGIDGLLILWIFKKAKEKGQRKPEYEIKYSFVISCLLAVMFIFGIIYTIWSLV